MSQLIAELYDEYQDRLHSYALTLCKNREDAGDLVQETFTRALANWELLSCLPHYKRQSWLFSVMKNCFIDIKRRQKREAQWDYDFESAAEMPEISDSETAGLLSCLPVPLRNVVFKKFWLGMNGREISDELSIPGGTVRYRLHIALKRLKEEVE